MKALAVDFYNQEIKELFNQFQDGEISGNMFHVLRLTALTKAKELEKQYIVSAFEIGYENGACTNENESIYHGGNYYNLTFKSE